MYTGFFVEEEKHTQPLQTVLSGMQIFYGVRFACVFCAKDTSLTRIWHRHRLLVCTWRTCQPKSLWLFFLNRKRGFFISKKKSNSELAVSLHAVALAQAKPAARRAARNTASSVKARCGSPQGGCKPILLPSALPVWAPRRAPPLCDRPLEPVTPQHVSDKRKCTTGTWFSIRIKIQRLRYSSVLLFIYLIFFFLEHVHSLEFLYCWKNSLRFFFCVMQQLFKWV